LTAKPNKIH